MQRNLLGWIKYSMENFLNVQWKWKLCVKRFFHCFVHREKDGVKKGESGEMKC